MNQPFTGFVAYPSSMREVRETLSSIPDLLKRLRSSVSVKTWETLDIPGRCLIDPIISELEAADFLLADITRLNFNVMYEIGYAFGKSKRVILLRNKAIKPQEELFRELGLLDTIGYVSYSNASDVCNSINKLENVRPLPIPKKRKNALPFFVVWPSERTEAEIRIVSRIKKQARLAFQQFDPKEEGRLPLNRALDCVVNSEGIILPLISCNRNDAEIHNLRCAFIAGVASSLDKELLLLQAGGEPVPLDYRDAVSFYSELSGIDGYLADFTPRVYEKTLELAQAEFPQLANPIDNLYIGQSNAENEHEHLSSYYIQTEEFSRVLRGEALLVTGRKGSGKTALFYQVRNKIRKDKKNVVLDLNPEGFQLRKLKSLIEQRMEEGTQEHTFTAFWEYLLFLELCYKLLEKDRIVHLHNHILRPKYIQLQELYETDKFISEGDFAERLLRLIEAIEENFGLDTSAQSSQNLLHRKKITELLYQHDLGRLRSVIIDYLLEKNDVWILFDNIDKGWAAHGVESSDLLSLRCLIDALRKISRDFQRSKIKCNCVVFVRNDVYEALVDSTPDRGKVNRASLDWSDPDLLREMLRRRFLYSFGMLDKQDVSFLQIWNSFAESHLSDGTETSEWIIQRCLMRPRSLLDLLLQCKSHAVNLGHSKIRATDFSEGERIYSTELVAGISLEIQDVFPCAGNALYAFIEAQTELNEEQLRLRLSRIVQNIADQSRLLDLLFWYGFLGFLRKDLSECYIYSVYYDIKKFKALLNNIQDSNRIYLINPAFHTGLDAKLHL